MIIQGVTLTGLNVTDVPPVITSGLVYYFDLGNSTSYPGSGSTIADLAGSGLGNATITNSPTYTSGYVTTNGTNQYLFTPNMASKFNSPSNPNYSLECWVNVPSDNGCIMVEEGSATPDGGWYDSVMEIVSGTLYMSHWNNAVLSINAGSFPRSRWNHCVLTYDGTTARTYLNTTAGATLVTGRQLPWANSYGYYHGIMCGTGTSMGNGTYLAGSFAQYRLYNRALTADEILQNYRAGSWRYGV